MIGYSRIDVHSFGGARPKSVAVLASAGIVGVGLSALSVYRGSAHMTQWPALLNGVIVGAIINLPILMSIRCWPPLGTKMLGVILIPAGAAVVFLAIGEQWLIGLALGVVHLWKSYSMLLRKISS